MIDQYPSPNGVLTSLIWRKTMSGGETSLSGYDNASQALSYTPGQEQVYLNGILLVRGDDYTATNGTSITGLSALAASDFIQVNCYNNFSVASLPSTSITGSITSSQVDSTIVTTTGTQTLTNKTLTTPTLTTPRFGSAGEIDDTNGNELIKFPATVASAVNEITVTNAAASGTPSISATGDDTNISLNLVAKGSGTVQSGGVPVVTTTGSQTLTNKTLTSPTITGASGVINNTLTTTTGDIIYASSANTPARLGIGSTNQVLTVSGGVPTWATPATSGFVGCSLYGFRTVLMSNGATTYAIPFTSEYFDTDNFHDNVTNNTRITIPSGKGGKYQINVQIAYDNASGTPGYFNWFVRIDGSGSYGITTAQLQNTTPAGISGSTNNSIVSGSGIISFNAGQYFEILSRTDNGNGNIYATPYVTVAYLGA